MKNRKSFITVIQIKGRKIRARIYRIKRNKPVYIGFVKFKKMFKNQVERDEIVISFLRYNGHIGVGHVSGHEFLLEAV